MIKIKFALFFKLPLKAYISLSAGAKSGVYPITETPIFNIVYINY